MKRGEGDKGEPSEASSIREGEVFFHQLLPRSECPKATEWELGKASISRGPAKMQSHLAAGVVHVSERLSPFSIGPGCVLTGQNKV